MNEVKVTAIQLSMILLLMVLGALVFFAYSSTEKSKAQFASVEVGYTELSPRGEAGGHAIPASSSSAPPPSTGGGGTPPTAPTCSYIAPQSGSNGADGKCGTAHNRGYSSKPTSGLCSAGSATAVGTGNPYLWTWTCKGKSRTCPQDGRATDCSIIDGGSCSNYSDGDDAPCRAMRTPIITSLEACDLGGGGCTSSKKNIFVEEHVQIKWEVDPGAGGVTGCYAGPDGFNLPTPTTWSGVDDDVREPYPGATTQFTLQCRGYWYNNPPSGHSSNEYVTTDSVLVYMYPLPNLKPVDPNTGEPEYSVPFGDPIDIKWDTGAPFDCVLTDGQNFTVDAPAEGPDPDNRTAPGSGTERVTIHNTTVFTLDCPNGVDSITVFAIPNIYEI